MVFQLRENTRASPSYASRTARTRTVLTATREAFRVRAVLDAYEGEALVFSRSWNTTVPRDLV